MGQTSLDPVDCARAIVQRRLAREFCELAVRQRVRPAVVTEPLGERSRARKPKRSRRVAASIFLVVSSVALLVWAVLAVIAPA